MDDLSGFIFMLLIVFIIGLFIVSFIKKALTNIRNEQKRKDSYEEERLKRIAQAALEQKERERLRKVAYETYFDDKEFINKNTTRLEDFIINDRMNQYDLEKLARLNGIQLEILGGWTDLVLALMVELSENGWKGKVASIKEKYAELRFYAIFPKEFNNPEHDAIYEEIMENYKLKSLETCEVCGEHGGMVYSGGWQQTLCEKHSDHPVFSEYIIPFGKK